MPRYLDYRSWLEQCLSTSAQQTAVDYRLNLMINQREKDKNALSLGGNATDNHPNLTPLPTSYLAIFNRSYSYFIRTNQGATQIHVSHDCPVTTTNADLMLGQQH